MPRRPPDPLIYYLDANLDGHDLVRRLRDAGVRCEPHRDHFPPDAEDEAWIPVVAARGWIIVTRDFAIQRRPAEREAWTAAKAIVVMVRGERLSAQDMAQIILDAHINGRLDNFIAKRMPPMVIYIAANGALRLHLGGDRRGGQKKS